MKENSAIFQLIQMYPARDVNEYSAIFADSG